MVSRVRDRTDDESQLWAVAAVLATIVVGFVSFAGVILSLLSPIASDPCGPDNASFICTAGGQMQTLLIGLIGTAVLGIGALVVGWTRRSWPARAGALAAGALVTLAWLAGYTWWISSLSP
ncbi:hypothetical protein BH24ACT9_BH24ACT9_17420 [soil metagenome]